MSAPAKSKQSDNILVVHEFWTLPISGVTTFEGAFHAFQRIFDEEAQDWSKSTGFMLQPLSGVELAQFNELDAIIRDWRADQESGKKRPHPQMPEAVGPEGDRYKELYRAVDSILHDETDRTVRCTGEMTLVPGENRYLVQWHRS